MTIACYIQSNVDSPGNRRSPESAFARLNGDGCITSATAEKSRKNSEEADEVADT